MFSSALPEKLMAALGKIYVPKPLAIKSRKELLAAIKPQHQRHLRADNGDLPEHFAAPPEQPAYPPLRVI
jgi:hypothetical protein